MAMSVVKIVKKERKKYRIYKIYTDKVVNGKKMKIMKDVSSAPPPKPCTSSGGRRYGCKRRARDAPTPPRAT
ncbi:hypothetical protein ACLOJK_027320 [Asimina triloba]